MPSDSPPSQAQDPRRDSHGAALPSSTSTGLDRSNSRSNLAARRRPLLRGRRSSLVSDFSQSMADSTENLLSPGSRPYKRERDDESGVWNNAPLAFAILPAVGGLFFENGSSFVTDVFLLVLGGLFLNWLVRTPWQWYRSAQAVHVVQPALDPTPTIFEETGEEESGTVSEEAEDWAQAKQDHSPSENIIEGGGLRIGTAHDGAKRDEAADELRWHENMALLSCFLGPLLGAYLLHAIRGQLTRPSEGLISNFNLTIFVLAAEIRPWSHLISLIQARTLHLQRLVEANASEIDKIQSDQISNLSKRLEDAEARIAANAESDSAAARSAVQETSITQINQALKQSFQPQVDALNRAVRRYEKRATTQTIQTEARLQDLELRLRDALSLAAAAANSSQKPGVIVMALAWLSRLFALPIQALWALVLWPMEALLGAFGTGKRWLFGRRRSQKSAKGKRSAKEKEAGYRIVNGTTRSLLTKDGRR